MGDPLGPHLRPFLGLMCKGPGWSFRAFPGHSGRILDFPGTLADPSFLKVGRRKPTVGSSPCPLAPIHILLLVSYAACVLPSKPLLCFRLWPKLV